MIRRYCVKITGFKPSRILEWLRVLKVTGRAKGRLRTGLLVAKAAWGALFETAVFAEIRKATSLLSPRPIVHHWRSKGGAEVVSLDKWRK